MGVAKVAAQSPTQSAQAGALKGVASDSHEGVIISVEPWTHAGNYKEKFPKKSPFTGGVVALHVTIRNNSDESVKVDFQRIRLLLVLDEENRQELAPLTADDVADTVLLKGGKDPTQRRNPLPMPEENRTHRGIRIGRSSGILARMRECRRR